MCKARAAFSLIDHFSALKDPRQSWRVVYPLREILLLVLCGSLCGMEDFVEIRMWGELRLDFLRRFYPYERGLPSHDTLNDVINALTPEFSRPAFRVGWKACVRTNPTSSRSTARPRGAPTPAPRAASRCTWSRAWAARQRLVLGQEAIDEKSNEITPSPRCCSGSN